MSGSPSAFPPVVVDRYLGKRLSFAADLTDGDRAVGPPQHGQMAKYLVRGWAYGLVATGIAFSFVLVWYVWRVWSLATDDTGLRNQFDEGMDLLVLTVALPFILTLVAFVAGLVGNIINWFVPDRLVAAKWELAIDTPIRADAVQEAIRVELVDRNGPFVTKTFERDHGTGETRRYVTADFDNYRAAIAVIPHQGSVWVNWAMWRTVLPVALMFEYLADACWTMLGKASLREQLRYGEARAFRECVHNATRAGFNKAIEAAADADQIRPGNQPRN